MVGVGAIEEPVGEAEEEWLVEHTFGEDVVVDVTEEDGEDVLGHAGECGALQFGFPRILVDVVRGVEEALEAGVGVEGAVVAVP